MIKPTHVIVCALILFMCSNQVRSGSSSDLLMEQELVGLGDRLTQSVKDKTPKTTAAKIVSADRRYDSLVMATEWAGSICRVKTCNSDRPPMKTFFNLHGLWPNDSVNFKNSPFTCTSTQANLNTLPADIQTTVKTFWNGMYGSQSDFLNHEWTKHGTCWSPEPADLNSVPSEIKTVIQTAIVTQPKSDVDRQINYIKTAVALGQKYNAFNALSASGILPNNSRRLPRSDLDKAFSSYFKVNNFQIICQKDKSGQSLLYEVRFCLDLNYRITECPNKNISCPDTILYPEYL